MDFFRNDGHSGLYRLYYPLCVSRIIAMGKLSAKYQFCAIHRADNTDGKVTIDHRLTVDVHRF